MKTIKISGFQSHKNTQLNLHENVNIIVGQSSSGKTAIFRAIEWLNTNRPLGTRFITHGEKESKVEIDGVVGAKHGNGKSAYNIGNDSFSAGSSVPDLVVSSLNLSELNVQGQLDEHFLITSSPGEVARTFNRILNIEKVDEYVSKLTTQINSTNTIIKEKTERSESLTNKINDLEYLDALQAKVLEAEEQVKLLTQVKLGVNNLTEAINNTNIILKKLHADYPIRNNIIKLLKEFTKPIEELKRNDILKNLLTRAIGLQEKNTENSLSLSCLTNAIGGIDTVKLKDMIMTGGKLKTLVKAYDTCVDAIVFNEKRRTDMEKSIELELDKYENEVKAFKICPVCRSPITDVNHIMIEVRDRYAPTAVS